MGFHAWLEQGKNLVPQALNLHNNQPDLPFPILTVTDSFFMCRSLPSFESNPRPLRAQTPGSSFDGFRGSALLTGGL